jgi:hypothetical protein
MSLKRTLTLMMLVPDARDQYDARIFLLCNRGRIRLVKHRSRALAGPIPHDIRR